MYKLNIKWVFFGLGQVSIPAILLFAYSFFFDTIIDRSLVVIAALISLPGLILFISHLSSSIGKSISINKKDWEIIYRDLDIKSVYTKTDIIDFTVIKVLGVGHHYFGTIYNYFGYLKINTRSGEKLYVSNLIVSLDDNNLWNVRYQSSLFPFIPSDRVTNAAKD